ncbi:MAG TPA: heavy metal-binding domain-containing protein [Burkholderiales bacterium]|jgi:hypothetical protein|nr:heavy metal-binding domain-containing protein [Burkholderiales bacterium]
MTEGQTEPPVYRCPMHREVRGRAAGKCPRCGMALVPEGARFGLLRHIARSPLMVVVMLLVMVAVMVMMLM